MNVFSRRETAVLVAIAEALIPAGPRIPQGNARTIAALDRYVAGIPSWAQSSMRAMIWTIETGALPFTGSRFSKLSVEARARLLERWRAVNVPAIRHALRSVLVAIKSTHFDNAEMFALVDAPYGTPPATEERARWFAQVTDGREVRDDADLEADVVIVGTGAGGATLAYELAARGHAVLMIEEGRYFRRHDFNGHAAEMARTMYRDGGMTIAFGNASIPVWAGVTVGGTTTVNSGTCYRTPERVMRRWREEFGLSMFSSASMDRHFARVESIIGVAAAPSAHLGGVARVIARGAEALGYVHNPLRRNAPDCDGQGVCVFGCPTGAKRSADVSYVPMALERGAALYSSTKVHKILTEGGRATGVVAHTKGGGKITVRARKTVVAGGTMMTPLLLLDSELANKSGMVGKNLSIHPAAAVLARFDERIDMHRAIPQGYAIEQFAEEGLMLEGASTPLDITAIALTLTGRRFIEVMEQFPNLAAFGFLIQDTSRGRVVRGPGGRPLMFYNLNDHDVRNMQRAAEAICRVFFAAGAREVFPSVHGFDELRSLADLERLHAHRLRAGDFDVTAYHPLGTARMGTDPRSSVVGPDHQTHDVRDLYVVDGSAVPSSLGVNPQVTIMAMATRAAEIIDQRLAAPTHSGRDDSRRDATSVGLEARA